MKTKAQPATVQELDQNDHPILHSIKSARRIAKPKSTTNPSPPRKINLSYIHKTTTVMYGKWSVTRSIEEMARIYQSYNQDNPLTIFTRSRDRSRERNEVPGCRFRKVFVSDDTEVLDSNPASRNKYIGLTAFIMEEDRDHPDPRIYVEQSIIDQATGKEKIMVHELAFGSNVQTEVDYEFPGCVDEHPVFGKRALRVRLQSLNEMTFETYMKGAGYYGYDRTEYAVVNKYMLNDGLTFSMKIPKNGDKSYQIVSLDPADLRILLEAKQKKVKTDVGLELLRLRVHGFGEYSERGEHQGALDLRVIYNPL